jgi:hypothetical protein
VVGEEAVVTKSDVFLLPLLIQGLPTSLQKDALEEREEVNKGSENVFLQLNTVD